MSALLVTCYQNPDLDGFAGAVAYTEFLNCTGAPAVTGIFGEPDEEVRWVMDYFHFPYPPAKINPEDYDRVVLIDASDTWGLASGIHPERVVEVYDHRAVHNAETFTHARLHLERVGAAATLIAEQFFHRSVAPSRLSSALLSGAIISNTLNFKARVTTDRDRRMRQWLELFAPLPADFAHVMFLAKSDFSGGKLVERLDKEYKAFHLGGKRLSVMQFEMIGVRNLVVHCRDEIVAQLRAYQRRDDLDGAVLSLVGVEEDCNAFVCADEKTQAMFSRLFDIRWDNAVAFRPGLIMRKEIMPLIKNYLEG